MIFARGLQAPEGPVAMPDGSWVLVEASGERGCVTVLSPDGGARTVIRTTGRPNGLAVDALGNLWVAESLRPSLLRLTLDGKCEVVATGCDSEPFLFPNDLCFGPDGALYLTDSGVDITTFAPGNRIRSDYAVQTYDGRLYRVDPTSGQVSKIDSGLLFPNGLAFGPDELLYVNETLTGNIYRYEWSRGAISGPRRLFGNAISPQAPPGWKGPDGMAFDEHGLLYVAVFEQGDVTVLGRDGAVVKRMATHGRQPSNVAFALPGRRRLHVTEFQFGQMESYEAGCDGLPLWDGLRRSPARMAP